MKKRLNSIDLIVIILVIVLVIAGYQYLTKDKGEVSVASHKVDVLFVAEADELSNEAVQQLKVGDRLIGSGTYQDAKIIDILVEDSVVLEAINGELQLINDPENKKITVTIEGKANKYGSYTDLGGQEIKGGSAYYIRTDLFEAFGYLVSVEKDKGEE